EAGGRGGAIGRGRDGRLGLRGLRRLRRLLLGLLRLVLEPGFGEALRVPVAKSVAQVRPCPVLEPQLWVHVDGLPLRAVLDEPAQQTLVLVLREVLAPPAVELRERDRLGRARLRQLDCGGWRAPGAAF